jgi:hypothetical protein
MLSRVLRRRRRSRAPCVDAPAPAASGATGALVPSVWLVATEGCAHSPEKVAVPNDIETQNMRTLEAALARQAHAFRAR